eukprot:CAMPEP_0113456924 /NCGR_PEP_ID=MMETSP0014_2-20120614/9140_1 /TAXON_ID=2857 /ORGANISM="Nitzschia sp." /LENGTH=1428 /DNA_ID=CAMNT_0000348397 /DNA_START=343 /DNA_END=4629 /DNA_ORIENTATION=- /assembly_acc=CAM_ASM_000159
MAPSQPPRPTAGSLKKTKSVRLSQITGGVGGTAAVDAAARNVAITGPGGGGPGGGDNATFEQQAPPLTDFIDEARKENMVFAKARGTDEFLALFRRSSDPDSKTATKVSLIKLLSVSTPTERVWMFVGILLATVAGCGIPAWLALLADSLDTFSNLGRLINTIGGEGLMETLEKKLFELAIAFMIVGLVVFVCGSAYVAIWTYTGERQALRIQKSFVQSAMNQDAAWFDANDREGLPTKMGTSIVHINAAIGRNVADTYQLFISALGCLVVAFLLNTPLALVMLAALPIVAIVMVVLNCFVRKHSRQSSEELALAGSLATEVIAGIKTVAALCSKPFFRDTYADHINESEKSSIKAGFLLSLQAGLVGMIFYIAYTIAFYVGSEQVVNNTATIFQLISCFLFPVANEGNAICQQKVTGASVMCCIYGVILCVTFIGLCVPGLTAINLGRQAGVHVFDTITRVPPINPSDPSGVIMKVEGDDDETETETKTRNDEKQQQQQPNNDTVLTGQLEFRDIFFAYPSRLEKPIFYNFNLKVQAGQSVALCGPSGSGKSTIARFLLRFYDPLQGSVLVDGVDLKDLNVPWWRSKIGYVEQEPRMFPGTIRDNIAFGKAGSNKHAEVPMDEIIDAAKAACAHEFITDLPDGYDTYFGGTGISLSGGQMQRISIARAIIRKPVVLVLDEATSALDSTSERHVTEALANVRKVRKMTTISIAHRLSTIVDSDLIAVLDQGRVVELGDHKTLYDRDGIYTLLCTTQGIDGNFTAISAEATPAEQTKEVETAKDPSAANIEDVEAGTEVKKAPTENDENAVTQTEEELMSMGEIWTYLGAKDTWYAVIGVIGSVLVGALSPAEAIVTANIVNNFYTQEKENIISENLFWIYLFFAWAGIALIGNMMIGVGLSRSGFRLGNKFRKDGFSSMLKRSMGWFDVPEHSTGDLTTLLGADAESTMALTGLQLGYRVRVMSSIITGVTIALIFAWRIGLIAVACMPFIFGASGLQAVVMRKKFAASTGGLTPPTILEQGLRGITSVQAYNLEPKVSGDYNAALEPETEGKVMKGVFSGLVYGFTQGTVFMAFGVIFYAGAQLLVAVKINFLEFFTALLSVMFGAIGASQVSADFSSIQAGRAAAARIRAVFDGPEDEPYAKGALSDTTSVTDLDGSIGFDHCEFSYPARPDNYIFYKSKTNNHDGLNVTVNAKESIAFVGKSGCGKSTALQLVLRFYDINAGACKLDGTHNVADLNINWWRQQIGYVGQMPVLFHGTVKENILLGKPDATDREIVEAAKAANCHEFVQTLANGYDTNIGTGGGQLSGGQRQRVAIARAVISQPKVLILDEATAALDNESEEKVQAALDHIQETQPRTTLVVAHRLMTVKKCEKICFLGDGGVEEFGSHDELLAKKGEYAKLWKMQGAAEELEKPRASPADHQASF